MKNLLKLLPLAFLMLTIISCDKEEDVGCACFEIYEPVCGDDGVEYSNSCYADCAGVSYTEGTCPIVTNATVKDLGDPAVDGCGWVLEFEVEGEAKNHRPDELAEELKIDDLTVQLTYQITVDSSVCGLGGFIPVVKVVEIVE